VIPIEYNVIASLMDVNGRFGYQKWGKSSLFKWRPHSLNITTFLLTLRKGKGIWQLLAWLSIIC